MKRNSLVINLSRNENHLGPNPLIVSKLDGFEQRLAFYPCINGNELKIAISQYHNIREEMIVLGNGSVQLLELSSRTLLHPGNEAIIPSSTFTMISQIVHSIGAFVINVPLNNWMIDLQANLNAISPHTRLMFIVNPNNPTGTALPRSTIIEFLEEVPPNIYVIVDEAYIDYVSNKESVEVVDLVRKFKNLIVTRTFSKAHGLAALRIGYCIAPPHIAKCIESYRLPFTNNALALEAATLSIKEQNYLDRIRDFNKAELSKLYKGLNALNLPFIQSVANFISIDFGSKAEMAFKELKERGVILAPQAAANMPGYLRATVGNSEENDIFLTHLCQLNLTCLKRRLACEA